MHIFSPALRWGFIQNPPQNNTNICNMYSNAGFRHYILYVPCISTGVGFASLICSTCICYMYSPPSYQLYAASICSLHSHWSWEFTSHLAPLYVTCIFFLCITHILHLYVPCIFTGVGISSLRCACNTCIFITLAFHHPFFLTVCNLYFHLNWEYIPHIFRIVYNIFCNMNCF